VLIKAGNRCDILPDKKGEDKVPGTAVKQLILNLWCEQLLRRFGK